MKILNFGSCNLDFVYTMDHIVTPGETEATGSFETFPGGKGLNQSIAAARAGAKVFHAGCIGTDGGMLRDIMAESGVDVSHLRQTEEKNGHAVIQVSRTGENAIFLYPGSNRAVTEADADRVLENFDAGDLLLLQNEINLVPRLVEKGAEKGMRIVLNPSPFNETIGEIDLSLVSYLILNEVEAKELSGSDDPQIALARLSQQYPNLAVVLTLGVKGCLYRDGDFREYCPAFRVKAVDTTAAGDTFTGYFLASLAEDLPIPEALRRASAASAIAVSRMGAAPSIPYRDEVEREQGGMIPYGTEENGSGSDRKKRIYEYCETCGEASLPGLARILGYTPSYTGALVRTLTGKNFSELLRELRCRRAAELLAGTDLPVGEIIYSVGYKNETFFRNAFREIYGCSPREYRKNKQGGSL